MTAENLYCLIPDIPIFTIDKLTKILSMKQQLNLVASACHNLFAQRLNVTSVPVKPTETMRAYR